jgi:hypothetical protein
MLVTSKLVLFGSRPNRFMELTTRDEQGIDQQGPDIVRRVDRDDLALELADLANRRSALDQQGQDVRLQERGFGDDAQVGPPDLRRFTRNV